MLKKAAESVPLIDGSTGTHTINYELDLSDTQSYKLPDDELFQTEIAVYRRRWWILFVFCLSAAFQGMCYVMWSVMSDSVLIAYGWTSAHMAMIPAATSIAIIASSLPVMYLVLTKGLRVGMIFANATMVITAIAWIIGLHTYSYWIVLGGSVILGLSPGIQLAGCSLISATWFPVNQRTTATSMAALGPILGFMVGFIFEYKAALRAGIGTAVYIVNSQV